MKQLSENDKKHVEAAGAWIHLGNVFEADKELDEITAELRSHPEVLCVRLEIYIKLEKWEDALHIINAITPLKPDRIKYRIQKSQILQKLGQTKEARDNIRQTINSKLWAPDDLFDMAIEAQILNWPDEAFACIRAGVGKNGFKQLKALALETPVLKPIHPKILTLE